MPTNPLSTGKMWNTGVAVEHVEGQAKSTGPRVRATIWSKEAQIMERREQSAGVVMARDHRSRAYSENGCPLWSSGLSRWLLHVPTPYDRPWISWNPVLYAHDTSNLFKLSRWRHLPFASAVCKHTHIPCSTCYLATDRQGVVETLGFIYFLRMFCY